MKRLGYSIWLQFKLDIRNKNILSAYYVLPLAFYLVVGAIYNELYAYSNNTLIQSMSVLAISLAAFLGTPAPIVNFFTSDAKKTYKVGNINLSVVLLTTFISAIAHISVISSFIFMTAPKLFNANITNNLNVYIVWLFLTIVISTVIGILIGMLSKNNSTMTMTSQLVFLPAMLLCGILLPTDILPGFLQKLGKILPATYSVEILTSLNNITLEMVLPLISIGLLALLGLIVVYRRTIII